MWTPAYIIPQAIGHDAPRGDRLFTTIFVAGTGIGVLSPVVSSLLDLSVVDMVILFPMYNGIFSLPIATALLFWAVNDDEAMGEYSNGWKLNVVNASLDLLAVVLAVLSVRNFLDLVSTGGF